MIHGDTSSVGCLAMGDMTIEEIFTLAAHIYPSEIPIILCPVDFRKKKTAADGSGSISWQGGLYADIRAALAGYLH